MYVFLTLMFLFALGSLIGYVIEFIYRRIVGGHFVNPGFLHGPYLPIYGLGVVILYLLSAVSLDFIPVAWLSHVVRILFMGAAMTAIEYVGGIVFIKGMRLKLWDYSKNWGNIQGVICPLFSLIWTALGALYYFLLNGFFTAAADWFLAHPFFSMVVGIFYGVFVVDLAHTMNLSLRIRKWAEEKKSAVRFEAFKLAAQKNMSSFREKFQFFAFLKSRISIEELLQKYQIVLNDKKADSFDADEKKEL